MTRDPKTIALSYARDLAGAVQRAVHRGEREPERRRDLLRAHAHDVLEEERRALARREPLEERDERQGHALAPLRRLVRIGEEPRVRRRREPPRVLERVRGLDRRAPRRRSALELREHQAAPPLEGVEAGVGGDGEEPVPERPRARPALPRLPRPEERVLRDVLRVGPGAHHAVAVAEELGAVRREEGAQVGHRADVTRPRAKGAPGAGDVACATWSRCARPGWSSGAMLSV